MKRLTTTWGQVTSAVGTLYFALSVFSLFEYFARCTYALMKGGSTFDLPVSSLVAGFQLLIWGFIYKQVSKLLSARNDTQRNLVKSLGFLFLIESIFGAMALFVSSDPPMANVFSAEVIRSTPRLGMFTEPVVFFVGHQSLIGRVSNFLCPAANGSLCLLISVFLFSLVRYDIRDVVNAEGDRHQRVIKKFQN